MIASFGEPALFHAMDAQTLHSLLTQPLAARCPVPVSQWPHYQLLAEHLFELESSTTAPRLLSALGAALHAPFPTGTPSELLYTPFWATVGLGCQSSRAASLALMSASTGICKQSMPAAGRGRLLTVWAVAASLDRPHIAASAELCMTTAGAGASGPAAGSKQHLTRLLLTAAQGRLPAASADTCCDPRHCSLCSQT